jgi:hypothetical protein
MSEISRSTGRGTFQKDNYIKRKEADGEDPNQDYIEMYKSFEQRKTELEQDPEWQKNNLEYDLRTTDWILEKARNSDNYAQNLYSALCNNEFQKRDVWTILKNQKWSCSCRYAGGIIADMQQQGDYIDWYCSVIYRDRECTDEEFEKMPKEQQESYLNRKNNYVSESVVTEEIEQDLLKLGWNVIQYGETDV